MVEAARYDITLDRPLRSWQGAFLLAHAIEQERAIVVTVHGYRPDGEFVGHEGRHWYRSTQLDAGFYYLPPASAGDVIAMEHLTHHESVSRLVLVVRPFAVPTRPVTEIVSTLCIQDLEPVSNPRHVVVSAYSPEIVNV